jgi:NAD(P)-dependent dehydrogenase (short-subunit alcohol dehydrogenase family)
MKLNAKVITVTGGFGNLGIALGIAAIEAGAQVALIDRASAPPTSKRPAALSSALLLGNVDLASFEAAQQALAAVTQRFGGLDILANVVGTFRRQTLADGDLANWDLLYTVNLKTAVVTSKAALPHLRVRGGGRIINVGADQRSDRFHVREGHARPGGGEIDARIHAEGYHLFRVAKVISEAPPLRAPGHHMKTHSLSVREDIAALARSCCTNDVRGE